MKTPTWEPSAGNLLAFMNANTECAMCDLYTFTTFSGVVYRYTSSDRLQSVNGNVFAMGPRIARGTVRSTVGVDVDSLNVDMYCDSTVLMGSQPFVQAMAQGVMDNGSVLVERLYLNSAGVPQGTLVVFSGRMGQVLTERGHAGLEVLSWLTLLDVQIPAALYQPSCRNILFNNFCTLLRSAYAINEAATSATDTARSSFTVNFTGTAAAVAGYCALGMVVGTSGANAGVSRTVKSHTGTGTGTITVVGPWPAAVAPGDTFTFYPGCDKTKATCISKFNNVVHFKGEPYVPLPSMVAQ